MGVLQPIPASQATRNSQDYYRINQPAVNNGDIFRLDVGVRAIVVGPESDFSEYTIFYYDVTKQSFYNLASVTVDQPWVGRLDSRLDVLYPGTNQKGFIYITPKNLYIPSAFREEDPDNQRWVQVWSPNIDLLCYTNDPVAIPDKRSLRRISTALQCKEGPDPRVSYVYVPCYGRKNWTARIIRAGFGATGGSVSARPINFVLPNLSTDEVFNDAQNWVGSFANEGETLGGTFNAENQVDFDSFGVLTTGTVGGRFDYVEIRYSIQDEPQPSEGGDNGNWQLLFEAYD